jgi:hypothetical protein
MGGERASKTWQRMTGKICCLCSNFLPADPDHHHGERLCAKCTEARRPKKVVRMFYYEWPMGLSVCFMEGQIQVGKRWSYSDTDRIYEILRAVHAPQEDHHAVAEALKQRRPGSVDLRLTEEQYEKLKRGQRGR